MANANYYSTDDTTYEVDDHLYSKLLIMLLALFPIVPMPIAGGVPFLVALIGLITCISLLRGNIKIDRTMGLFLSIAFFLLFLEGVSYLVHFTSKDFTFFLARGLWVLTSVAVVFAMSPWVANGRTDIFANVLALGLLVLLVAMFLESALYPNWEQGRQFGQLNLPFPRATGVPNSDGKLGTFLVICLTFYLFVRPNIALWQKLVLSIGPWVGLAFTQSRSTLLALMVAYTVYWVCRLFSASSFWEVSFRLVGAILGLIAIIVLGGSVISALVGEGIYQRNVDVRFHHLEYGIRQISEGTFFGSGAGAIREEADKSGIHNTAIAMSVKSGILSGIVVLSIIAFSMLAYGLRSGVMGLAWAVGLGITVEHMLYPGFINEFLVFPVLALNAAYNSRIT